METILSGSDSPHKPPQIRLKRFVIVRNLKITLIGTFCSFCPGIVFERTMIIEAYIPFSVILRAFAKYVFNKERFVATMRALIVTTTLYRVSVS